MEREHPKSQLSRKEDTSSLQSKEIPKKKIKSMRKMKEAVKEASNFPNPLNRDCPSAGERDLEKKRRRRGGISRVREKASGKEWLLDVGPWRRGTKMRLRIFLRP